MTDARFPRQARVRVRADFDRIFQGGRRVALPMLALHWLADGQAPRLGLAVSRKVDKRAVGRNRIKRLLRDEFRHIRPRLLPGAYVLVARPSAATATPAALREAMGSLLRRAGALPHPAPDGTMPAADSRTASPPPPTAPSPSGE
jgi:ribonuclease P protein component